MTTQVINGEIEQVPTPPNAYLTKLTTEDEHDRLFADKVSYQEGHRPWDECTQEFFEDWCDKYLPKPEPEQPESV